MQIFVGDRRFNFSVVKKIGKCSEIFDVRM